MVVLALITVIVAILIVKEQEARDEAFIKSLDTFTPKFPAGEITDMGVNRGDYWICVKKGDAKYNILPSAWAKLRVGTKINPAKYEIYLKARAYTLEVYPTKTPAPEDTNTGQAAEDEETSAVTEADEATQS